MKRAQRAIGAGPILLASSWAQAGTAYDGAAFQQGLLAYERSVAEHPYAGDDVRGALAVGFIRGVSTLLVPPQVCLPDSPSNAQLIQPVEQWMMAHPEQGGFAPSMTVSQALQTAYPCVVQPLPGSPTAPAKPSAIPAAGATHAPVTPPAQPAAK